jgi:hypothetical protein
VFRDPTELDRQRHFLGPVAGFITVVALSGVLRAETMPEWGSP